MDFLSIEDALELANPPPPSVSPRAEIAGPVRLGAGCVVHPFAIVGHQPSRSAALARQPDATAGVTVGARTIVSPHAVIYAGVSIGDDCLIGDGASIREGTVIGSRCIVGRHATVMHDVSIADDVHIHDGAHITGECVIGEGCFFGPGALTSNDRRLDPKDYRFTHATPPRFGRYVLVGTGANVLAGISVGDYAVIGIGAVVVDDVPPSARVLGPKAIAK